MNRTKLIMVGVLFAFIALLVVGSIHLTKSQTAAREARDRRDTALASLQKLYTSKPFPSMQNAADMRQDVQSLTQMRDAMTNTLASRDIPTVPLSPSRFIQELQIAIRDRLQATAPIVEGVRVVPDGFAFGFDRYLTTGAPMPRDQDVPRLAQQLDMIERLIAEVYASQVGTLRRLGRDEFDHAAGPDEDDSRVARRRTRREPGGASRDGDASVESEFYRAQRFTLEVSGRQAAIGDLLNRLAAMPMFVIVTDVELRKSADDLRAPQPAATAATAAAPATAVPRIAENVVDEKISKRFPSQRLVSGPEIDPPIQARIEIEIYNFAKEGD